MTFGIGVAAAQPEHTCVLFECIGEAQVYSGRLDDQFECHLASVKHRCISVGLLVSLSVIRDMEAQVYLGRLDDQFECHLASVKPRCLWVGLVIGLIVVWHR